MRIREFIRGYRLPWIIVGIALVVYFFAGRPGSGSTWWILALLTTGLADPILTAIGTRSENVQEAAPVMRWVFGEEPSFIPMTLAGLGLLAIFYFLYFLMGPNPFRDMIPYALTIYGVYAIVANITVIIQDRA